jgi:hypothetical protein
MFRRFSLLECNYFLKPKKYERIELTNGPSQYFVLFHQRR